MTKAVALHNKQEIEEFLSKNIHLQVYSIGDLDDFFFPYTQWYGIMEGTKISALAFIYFGLAEPTLLSFSVECHFQTKLLLKSISNLLPAKLYAHLSEGLADVLADKYSMLEKNTSLKMSLLNKDKVLQINTSECIPLKVDDFEEAENFYKESYPESWFDARMLETKQYLAIRLNGEIVSIAGVHVYSETYKVAALANIATHPRYRRNGYGRMAVAAVCKQLLKNVDVISLNVIQTNFAAIKLYQNLGFEAVGTYHEYEMNLI